jgi:hypothetical protein
MRPNTPTCFISYSHQDIDRKILQFFLFVLKKIMNDNVNIVYDGQLAPGQNIRRFMERTLDVDVAILLLSPSYKDRVAQREGGVAEEFSQITNRYWQVEQELAAEGELKEGPRFQLIPVLLSGTRETSVPAAVSDLLYIDLVGLTGATDRQGNFVVTDHIKSKYLPEIQKIADQLIITSVLKGARYAVLIKNYYDDLFVDTKMSIDTIKRLPNFISEIFVPTISFNKLYSQLAYFLIGRKGSGKSTIATALPKVKWQKFNGSIRIVANHIHLNLAYNLLNKATLADMASVMPSFSFFSFSWQGFLCLCLMSLLVQLKKEEKLTAGQQVFMDPIQQFLDEFYNHHQTDNPQGAMFAFAITRLEEFWTRCIDNARHLQGNGKFFTDIELAFNEKEYLEFLLGPQVVDALSKVIKNCQKRVLITLDDFDTIFDTFRRESTSIDARQRAQFEIAWLRSFLLLALEILDGDRAKRPFFSTLDFCITIPKDRYLEIERTDRDGFRYNNRTCHILWSGVELGYMLLKRFEKMTGYKTRTDQAVQERLADICGIWFKPWPKEISFEFNGRQMTLPLFCYILRHTFWRPRDVLLYYSSLLAGSFALDQPGASMSTAIIRRIVSETTYQIIRTEFIDEYETVIPNIRQVINGFQGAHQLLSYEELRSHVAGTRFHLSQMPESDLDVSDKIEFLYDLGFLGISLDRNQREFLNISCPEAFYFNEGTAAFRSEKKNAFRDTTFVIHPIFSENLRLRHSRNDFILNFGWHYLQENHAIIAASGNQF